MPLLDRLFRRSEPRYIDVEKVLDVASRTRFEEPRAWGTDPWATILMEGRGTQRPFNTALLRNLAQSEWAGMCIERIVNDVTSIDWTVGARREGDKANQKDVGDAIAFLDDLNANQITLAHMLEMVIADMLEIGNGVMVKTMDGRGRLNQVGAYDAETFFIDADQHGTFNGYVQYPLARTNGVVLSGGRPASYPMGGQVVSFTPGEVAWFTKGARSYRFYGLSPTEKLNQRLQLLIITLQQETAYFKEGSLAPGLLSFPEMTKDQYDEFMGMWDLKVKGKPHKMPMARAKAEYTKFGYNYQELQFLDRQTWYQKLVCAQFGVPATYLGLSAESTNRATDVSQTSNYKRSTLRPYLNTLEAIINQRIIWPHVSKDLRFQFKPSLDLAERQILSGIRETDLRAGTRTINEIRDEDGLKPLAWGDEPFPSLFGPTPTIEEDAPQPDEGKDAKPSNKAGAASGPSPVPLEGEEEAA